MVGGFSQLPLAAGVSRMSIRTTLVLISTDLNLNLSAPLLD